MTFRHLLSWKTCFYEILLPSLRLVRPRWGDAILGGLGQLVATAWPGRKTQLASALGDVRRAIKGSWDEKQTLKAFEGNIVRFLARDTLWDGPNSPAIADCFEVSGIENLEAARGMGRGVILVGCHLGSHVSSVNWLFRNDYPLRMVVQRPQHVSRLVSSRFDVPNQEHSQAGFFVNRQLSPEEASKRIFRTRTALRDGMIVYLMGDVPWESSNSRSGSLLGREQTFQSLWADFAALFKAPVVAVFSTYEPGGKTRIQFEPPVSIRRGEEDVAVRNYLARLEAEIAAHPENAVAHVLWPCYGTAPKPRKPRSKSKRRQAARAEASSLSA